jgi:cytidine deaminase
MDDKARQELMRAATEIRERAYCPYSEFAVGAALLDDQGTIHVGVNVENASYPVGVCAERNALFSAVTKGSHTFVALALMTPAGEATAPCGMCRQALSEFAPDLPLFLGTPQGEWLETTLSDVFGMQIKASAIVNNRNK